MTEHTFGGETVSFHINCQDSRKQSTGSFGYPSSSGQFASNTSEGLLRKQALKQLTVFSKKSASRYARNSISRESDDKKLKVKPILAKNISQPQTAHRLASMRNYKQFKNSSGTSSSSKMMFLASGKPSTKQSLEGGGSKESSSRQL